MTAIDLDTMERAFAARDRTWDGRFVAAVATTRIYCRPSCPARRPRPENVCFYATGVAAEEAGFRPCKRCAPEGLARDETAVARAIELLRKSAGPVTLADLALACGYSPGHLQRVFKRATGLSPAAYARAVREERALEALSAERQVTGAIYRAGFESPSRFYAAMEGKLGMSASAWTRGGAGVTIRWAAVETTLGPMLVAATDKGVCRVAFGEGRDSLAARFPAAVLVEGGAGFANLLAQVVEAVEDPGTAAAIPLDVAGTAFQQRVWDALRTIPPGETRSYAQLAAVAGHPSAVRAAGSANGANPVAVLIPCHRVIRANGDLGGYAYGPALKRELLAREKTHPADGD